MRYCKTCLTTDLRPNAVFYGDNCIACHYNSDNATNYDYKFQLLRNRIENIKNEVSSTSEFDCLVGVSGGKDSTRQALWVREKLGLNPLLVCCTYPPLQMTDIGAHNLENLAKHDFDLITVCPSPDTARRLAKAAFFHFGNVCKASEIALFASVPRIAIDYDIPIIFWGENPATQVGDSAVLGEDEFDGNNLRNLNTLSTGGEQWIRDVVNHEAQASFYQYPSADEFQRKNIQILYLGPAWDNWSMETNSIFSSMYGLKYRIGDELFTGDSLGSSMLDEEFTNINMMLKYYKFGFGRATDLANEMIRLGTTTREDSIPMVKQYDGLCSDKIIERFCEFIDISVDEFWQHTHTVVNPELFYIPESGRPIPKFEVGIGLMT